MLITQGSVVQVHAGPQRSNRGVGVVKEGVVEIVLLLGVYQDRSGDCKPLQGLYVCILVLGKVKGAGV